MLGRMIFPCVQKVKQGIQPTLTRQQKVKHKYGTEGMSMNQRRDDFWAPVLGLQYMLASRSSLIFSSISDNKFIPTQVQKKEKGMSRMLMSAPRLVVKKILPRPQPEGDRAIVRRSIGSYELDTFDPFLLLDEATIESPAGFPDHPHRGFETVSYMLKGSVNHEDFEGHKGTIKAGGIQWMTAGRGILHSEMPPPTGSHRALQLWVNLAAKDKMVEPKYQELESKEIAEAENEGVKVRIIAGESMGVKSPIFTRTPTMYLDFTLRPGSHFQQPIPHNWNAFIYVLDGEGGVFGDSKAKPTPAHNLLLLGPGDSVEAWNKSSTEPVRFILVGGEPLNEPIARYGPFVMNTQQEIHQAIRDYNNYANGFEKARHWRSRNGA